MRIHRSYLAVLGMAYAHPANAWTAALNVIAAGIVTVLGVIALTPLVVLGMDALRQQAGMYGILWRILGWTTLFAIVVNWLALLRGLAALNRPHIAVLVPGFATLLRRILLAGWATLTLLGSLLAGFGGGVMAMYAWGLSLGLVMMRPGASGDRSWSSLSIILWVQLLMPQVLAKIDAELLNMGARFVAGVPLPLGLLLMGASVALGIVVGFPSSGRYRPQASDKLNQEEVNPAFLLRAQQTVESLLPRRTDVTQPGEVMWRLVARDSLAVLPAAAGIAAAFALVSLMIFFGFVSLERQVSFIHVLTISLAALPIFQFGARVARQLGATRQEQVLYSLAPRRSGSEVLATLLLRRALGTWLAYVAVGTAFLWYWSGHGGAMDIGNHVAFIAAIFSAGLLPLAGTLKNYASLEQSSTSFNGIMIGACLVELLTLSLAMFMMKDAAVLQWVVMVANVVIVVLTTLWRRQRMLRAPPPFPAWRMA